MLQRLHVRGAEHARRVCARRCRRMRCAHGPRVLRERERARGGHVRDAVRGRLSLVQRHEPDDVSGALVRPRRDVHVQPGDGGNGERLRLLAVVVRRHRVLRADQLARRGPRMLVPSARLHRGGGRLLLSARRYAAELAVMCGRELLRDRRSVHLPAQLLHRRAHGSELHRADARHRARLRARPEARRELLDPAIIYWGIPGGVYGSWLTIASVLSNTLSNITTTPSSAVVGSLVAKVMVPSASCTPT